MRNFWCNLQTKASYARMVCLCAMYLIGSFQGISTAAELEGLVVYFAFEEGAGKTVADLSGNGQDGKLEGDTSWTDGKFGKSVNFGGKNGIVRVEHSDAFEFTDGITIAAWILPTLKAGPGTWQLIAAKGPDVQEFFEVLLHPDGFIWMGWKLTGGRNVPAQSPHDVVKDKWQHVAVSFQTGKWWTVYLDGEVLIDYPKTGDKLVPIDAPLMLGTEEPPALNRYYNGVIDEFALFNRGLSQDEIKEIQGGIQEILAVDPDAKLPMTWGLLKRRYEDHSKSN